jgi:peptidoglycan/LPS O-acetylase OafA/YrhL
MKLQTIVPASATTQVNNIQALRAIAALLVVWTHLKFTSLAALPHHPLAPWIGSSLGASGVDIFFVISGFVITMTATKRHHRPLDFFLARLARIAPLYLLLTLYEVARHPGLQSFRSVWNGIFYLPIFDTGSYTTPPVLIGWTLSFEMWFYTAFALLLIWLRPARISLFLPILFLTGAAAAHFYSGSWYFPRFAFNPMVVEFAAGSIIYQTRHYLRGAIPWVFAVIGLLALAASAPKAEALSHFGDALNPALNTAWERVLNWGFPAALLVAGAVGLEQHFKLYFPRFVVSLGTISYSLYLTHLSTLATLDRVAGRLSSPFVLVALQVVACVAVAWLCYLFVEHPLTERAQRWAKSFAGKGATYAAKSPAYPAPESA